MRQEGNHTGASDCEEGTRKRKGDTTRPLFRCHRLQVTLTTQAHIPNVDQHNRPDHGRRRRPKRATSQPRRDA
jgi:hypothetical protein